MDESRARQYMDSFIERLKSNKKVELGVYGGLALLCLLLLILPGGKGNEAGEEYMAAEPKYTDEDRLEQRLTDTLSLVRGAGRVQVMITYETGAEIVPAMSTDVSESLGGLEGTAGSRTESMEPVTLYQDGENEAIVLMERMPQVRGVIVVAEGAADISVRMKLQAAVQAVLGVEASRVEVLEMGIKGMEE